MHITSDRTAALSAERVYDVHCVAFGSRPAALVSWWLGGGIGGIGGIGGGGGGGGGDMGVPGEQQLLDHSTEHEDGGNVTRSTLRFQPKAADIGKLLRCRAENPVMPASQMEDTWALDINCELQHVP